MKENIKPRLDACDRSTSLKPGWIAAIVAVIAIAVFSASLQNGYTHDDLFALRNNHYYRANQILKHLFDHDYFRMSEETTYRPIVTVSYAVDHMIWTREPPANAAEQWTAERYKRFVQENLRSWRIGMHIHNLLLHVVNCLLVFILVRRLWDTKAAFIAAMLFAIHPIQAEVVNAVGYREDSQSMLFVLLTMIVFLTWRSRAAMPVAALCYALALFAKESALLLPAALFAVEWLLGWRKLSVKRLLPAYGWLAAAAVLYVAVRFRLLYNPMESTIPYHGGSFGASLLTTIPTVVNELKLTLLPIEALLVKILAPIVQPMGLALRPTELSVHYDIIPSTSLFAPEVLIALAYLSALGATLIALRRRVPLLTAGFVFYFIMLLPTCNIVPIAGILNDRFLYTPIIGLFIPVGIGLGMAWDRGGVMRRRAIAVSVAAFFVICAVQSAARTQEWRDERILSISTIRTNHASMPSWLNYAADCTERGNLEEARRSLEHLADLQPESSLPHAQLGMVLEKLGKPKEAEEAYLTSLAREPHNVVALNCLGILHFQQRRYKEAIPYFDAVIARHLIPEILVNLATSYSFIGERDKAEEMLNQAARECAWSELVHNALGNIYYRTKRYEEALQEHHRALQLSPGNIAILQNVVADNAALGRYADAIPYLRLILKQEPWSTETRAKLAGYLIRTGRADEARTLIKEAPPSSVKPD